MMTTSACTTDAGFGTTPRALRIPLSEPVENGALLLEFVRCATLAAHGHNKQPWKFACSPEEILILPDLSRRTLAVDPDEHHVWVSLGSATESHSKDIREYEITSKGVVIMGDRLTEYQGLITGIPEHLNRSGNREECSHEPKTKSKK